ncbi:MAG: MBL fold metallo-hydrolase [Deltaproteobacteria bacterium]|nr:MBL fold metallo-hydrolase [Deltaproteobacteria bacterium]MBW2017748.1 MBL fold metallo-hydrolase [Deltaproteobacteria bacterium]
MEEPLILTEPGRISDHILLLGLPESCVYFVEDGDEGLLLGGGMSYLAPEIHRQIEAFQIDENKIRAIVILHAHFDHCGLVPYLKRRWPWAEVMASGRAKKLLDDEKVSRSIARLNQAAIEKAGLVEQARKWGFEFSGIEVERILKEGDRLSCGSLDLEILEVPGHSTCSIAVYMPRERALFASDAAGVRYKDFFMAAGNSNYDLYLESLEKMSCYDVDILLAEHYGAVMGDEARETLRRAIETARETRIFIEESYRRNRDIGKATEEVARYFQEQAPEGFLDPEVLDLVAGQMVRYIARTLDRL